MLVEVVKSMTFAYFRQKYNSFIFRKSVLSNNFDDFSGHIFLTINNINSRGCLCVINNVINLLYLKVEHVKISVVEA